MRGEIPPISLIHLVVSFVLAQMATSPVRETGFETGPICLRLGTRRELEIVPRAGALCDVVTAHAKPVSTLASRTKVKAEKLKWSISLNEESHSGDMGEWRYRSTNF
jgi:hypothetical protein